MKQPVVDETLISMCGLYCGACRAFLKEKCPGCGENVKAAWCKIRTCCLEKGIDSCADCGDYSGPEDCRKFNNVPGRIIGFFLNSDRGAGIRMIKEQGRTGFAAHMTGIGRVALKRRG